MPIEITETVLAYEQRELDAWRDGDKSLVPGWLSIPDIVLNQPAYHFGEYFVLRHYSQRGWKGFVHYAIGEWEPGIQRYDKGRAKVEELFAGVRLDKIREVRRGLSSGEPDLFLYNDVGEALFIEVKKQSDRIKPEQLQCLAQIRTILQARVGIVYLREVRSRHTPKVYCLPDPEQSWNV